MSYFIGIDNGTKFNKFAQFSITSGNYRIKTLECNQTTKFFEYFFYILEIF